jgi:NAD-dependent dihydropyrimidine dehydrogenase PreA subunit
MDCIHPRRAEPGYDAVPQLYVNPEECVDCGACVPVCLTNSVFILADLPPELEHCAEENAAFYRMTAATR